MDIGTTKMKTMVPWDKISQVMLELTIKFEKNFAYNVYNTTLSYIVLMI